MKIRNEILRVEVKMGLGLIVVVDVDVMFQGRIITMSFEGRDIPIVLSVKKYRKANLIDIVSMLEVSVIPSYDKKSRRLNRNKYKVSKQRITSVTNKNALLFEGKSTQQELAIIHSKNKLFVMSMRTGKKYRHNMKSEIKKVVREGMRISVELVDGSVLKYSIKELLDSKHLLKSKRKNKYSNIDFVENGILQRHDVHRLIYLAYVKRTKGKQAAMDLAGELIGPGSNLVIHHINGDFEDNRLENLQCITRSEHSKLHNKKDI